MVDTIMKVNFYATLRPIVGKKTVELSLPDGYDSHSTCADVRQGLSCHAQGIA